MTAQCAPTSFGVGQLSIACDCQIAIFCSLQSPAAMEWSLGDLYLQALALHPPTEARDSRTLRILHTVFIPLSYHSNFYATARTDASSEPNAPNAENTAWCRSRGGGDPGPCKCARQTHTSAVLCLVIGLTIRASQRGRRDVSSGFDLICPECRHRRGRSCRGESRTVHPTKVSLWSIPILTPSLPGLL